MDIFLYNTLTREKELFKPINKELIGMYTCGPTVYNNAHLGNLRTYLFEDFLKRVLQYNGYQVKHVMNITDVGHLTGDGDSGEDKIEKESKKENKSAWEITEFYFEKFKADLVNLNIILPDLFCRATDHIKEQINLIAELESKGFTYNTRDGVYFDTNKANDYAKLVQQNILAFKAGARIEINNEKRNPTDFALWKLSDKDEKRQMEWDSPWGIGFPGWHTECSAMSLKYLGEQFDIHCGGVDLCLHHSNEIAQVESITNKVPWVSYWLHGEFLNLKNDEKMAKSTGNFSTLKSEFVDKNIDPLVYRYATMSVIYRKPMEWSNNLVTTAQNSYHNLLDKVRELGQETGQINDDFKIKFSECINDDLNFPKSLVVVLDVIKSNLINSDKLATILDFDKVLGLNLKSIIEERIPEKIINLANEREIARHDKKWQKSDDLREQILNLGYIIKDTDLGYQIQKK
jgi:cysteinyl-tRNA synthetase